LSYVFGLARAGTRDRIPAVLQLVALRMMSIDDEKRDVRSYAMHSCHAWSPCLQGDRSMNAGFTLIEMLVVMTIMARVATIAVPLLAHPSGSLTLETTTRALAGALRFARAEAIAQNVDIALDIDVDQRTFQSTTMPLQRFEPGIVAELRVAEPERVTSSHGAFRFFPDGSSTGGDIILRLRDKEARICVNWLTGEAHRSRDC
jgi:general secretion pathway protein H